MISTLPRKLVLAILLLFIPGIVQIGFAQDDEAPAKGGAGARRSPDKPDWVTPFPAFHVAGNIYFVGTLGLGDFIITTPQGSILIASTVPASVPMLKESMQKLNLNYKDIKIILHTHAHYDHIGGNPMIQEETGAQYMVMDRDVPIIEKGGPNYRGVKPDRILHDGDKIELGGVVLTAHLTPGHTKGCATYTMKITEGGKTYDVVFLGGTTMGPPGVPTTMKLVNNKDYPQIADDYRMSYRYLKSISPDIWLGAHSGFFNLQEKYPNLKPGQPNPFIDPAGYKAYINKMDAEFEAELKKQEDAAKASSN